MMDSLHYYILSIHTLILLRIFGGFVTATACFYAAKALWAYDRQNHGLEKIRTAIAGFGVFHLMIACLGVFTLLTGAYEYPSVVQGVITCTWTIGVLITAFVTVRLALYLLGVSDLDNIVQAERNNP